MRLKRHKEDDRAEISVCVTFPIIAKEWLDSIGYCYWPLKEGFEMFFPTMEMAKFYARRWNGRLGQAFVEQQKQKAVSA